MWEKGSRYILGQGVPRVASIYPNLLRCQEILFNFSCRFYDMFLVNLLTSRKARGDTHMGAAIVRDCVLSFV